MRKFTAVWITLAAFAILLAGYTVGRMRTTTRSTMESLPAATAPSGNALATPQPLDTWQKIVARSSSAIPRDTPAKTSDTRHEAAKTPLPTEPFGRVIAQLKLRADGGDADAAYALAQGFRACHYFVPPSNAAEAGQRAEDATVQQLEIVDRVVDYAKNQAAKQGKTLGAIPDVPVRQVYQGNLDAENEQALQCAGVNTHIAGNNWTDWQKRAAELHNLGAELGYWHIVLTNADVLTPAEIVSDKQVIAAGLEDAMSRGDARALIAIGHVLQAGLLAPPDSYLAYAYYYAAAQAPSADTGTLPWMGNNLMVRLISGADTQQYLQQQLALTGANLSRVQQLAAQQLGMDFFRQCCQGGGR